MRKQKGFTLVELIVVIAIIGILLAVLIPTWSYFIMKANVRSQNNYSKVIFNAAQTEATRYEVKEKRDYSEAIGDGTKDSVKKARKNLYLASGMKDNGDFEYYIYWDKKNAYRLESDGVTVDATADQANTDNFARAVNRVFGESQNTVYKIYIKNYQVESVCCAPSEGSANVGSYPIVQEHRSDIEVRDYNMKHINTSTADD